MPGMYVRAMLEQGIDEQALLLPQLAVSRNAQGDALALVVAANNLVQQRTLSIEPAGGNQWRVSKGLQAGDRVIVQGMQNARIGAAVTPVIVTAGAVGAAGAAGAASAATAR